jgi:hypothetical protein
MVKSFPFFIWRLLFPFFGTTILTGCSLIGFGFGRYVDPDRPGASILIGDSLDCLSPGTRVYVVEKDSSMTECKFKAFGQVPDTMSEVEYAREFDQWRLQRDKDSQWNPPFGTSIQVRVNVPAGRTLYAGRFAGFERGLLRVSCTTPDRVVRLKPEFIADIYDSLGQVLASSDAIYQALQDNPPGRVRFTPGVIFDGGPHDAVALDSIHTIYRLEPGYGKWIGLFVGTAIDMVVISYVRDNAGRILGPLIMGSGF